MANRAMLKANDGLEQTTSSGESEMPPPGLYGEASTKDDATANPAASKTFAAALILRRV
jgi:hypothetical protein